MTDRKNGSSDEPAKAKAKASVLETIGTLIGDDTARRAGAERKQAPDATEDGQGKR